MDRLEAMSVIIAVTETGSFSAAARKLGTPVATVSPSALVIGVAIALVIVRRIRRFSSASSISGSRSFT